MICRSRACCDVLQSPRYTGLGVLDIRSFVHNTKMLWGNHILVDHAWERAWSVKRWADVIALNSPWKLKQDERHEVIQDAVSIGWPIELFKYGKNTPNIV